MEITDKLGAIKHLCLFNSTKDEFISEFKRPSLKHNSLSKLSEDQKKLLYLNLQDKCKSQTNGDIDLDKLLEEYEASSDFYKKKIHGTKKISSKENRFLFLDLILGDGKGTTNNAKVNNLYKEYKAANINKPLNKGIILLLTLQLIPTFKNKKSPNVTNIVDEFTKIMSEITDYFQYRFLNESINELLYTLRNILNRLTETDIKNRLELIYYTNTILDSTEEVISPQKLLNKTRSTLKNNSTINREFKNKLWKRKGSNFEFWHLHNHPHYPLVYATLYVLNPDNNDKILHIEDNVIIVDKVNNNTYSYIILPSIDGSRDSLGSIGIISTNYDKNGNIINLTFSNENGDFTLEEEKKVKIKKVNLESPCNNCNPFQNHTKIKPLLSEDYIIFPLKNGKYKLILSDDAKKDIPLISELTHKDLFVEFESETEEGFMETNIVFVNQFFNLEDLLKKPYFKKIENIKDLF